MWASIAKFQYPLRAGHGVKENYSQAFLGKVRDERHTLEQVNILCLTPRKGNM